MTLEVHPTFWFAPVRQHKLEEALLFSGRFTDALQALNDWLYRAEPQLAEDVPVGGDKDMVLNLIDKHKVQHWLQVEKPLQTQDSPSFVSVLIGVTAAVMDSSSVVDRF